MRGNQEAVRGARVPSTRSLAAAAWGTPQHGLAELALRASDGDERATEQLLSAVRVLVHRYCLTRLGTLPGAHHSADDAAQEVCLTVLTALPRYRHEGRPFEAFVYRIASRRVADAMRAAYRDAVPVDEVPDSVCANPTPEDVALRTAEAARVDALLHQLPRQQREILTLRVGEGFSAAETADALGMRAGAVRVAQHRALARLRTLVPAQRGGSDAAVPDAAVPDAAVPARQERDRVDGAASSRG